MESLAEERQPTIEETRWLHGRGLFSSQKRSWIIAGCFIASFACNILLAIAVATLAFRPRHRERTTTNIVSSTVYGKSRVHYLDSTLSHRSMAGLSHDPAAPYPWSSGYGPEITNHSLADERWEAIDINDGIIVLDDDYALEHNLSPSQRFPWDPSKGVYLLNSFHNLHCLKNIHRLLYDAHHGRPLSRDIGHAMHCVDHMRKDIMCDADDFPLPSPPSRHELPGPRGQTKVCKNWDVLLGWARERNACYQHITDDEDGFALEHHEIERYQNCPPGSPYYEIMKSYFDTR